MDAKCNITGLVLEQANKMFYGISCKDNSQAIVENYIEYLNCSTVPIIPCFAVECKNDPTFFRCSFNVVKISLVIDGNTLTYSIEPGDFVGGTSPFTYAWSFETDDFIVSGPINTRQLILMLRPGKILSALVSKVFVTITDANGCIDTKECWFNKGDLRCSQNFVPCPNPSNLRLTNPVINCVAPINLRVAHT